MGYAELERDLALIRRTMEASTRYRNIPAGGYIAAGLLASGGTALTWALLGSGKVAQPALMTAADAGACAAVWGGVLVLSLAAAVLLSAARARARGTRAWSSLAARMFLSQAPAALAVAALTAWAAARWEWELVPGVWLLGYGVITWSFSYFAGSEHKVMGGLYLLLGGAALFAAPPVALFLLGAGMGGVHLAAGVVRLARRM